MNHNIFDNRVRVVTITIAPPDRRGETALIPLAYTLIGARSE